MPARKRPTPEDTVTARRVLLDGLARDADIFARPSDLAPLHPRNNTFPGEVFLHVAADALDWCGARRADPLPLQGLRERFLPECTFRGRDNKKLQYAVLAAAALHGGTEPDLLDEVARWQTDDFWQYALFAAVAYIRAAASRAGVPVRQVLDQIGPVLYAEFQASLDPVFPRGRRYYWKSTVMRELSDGAIAQLIELFASVPSPFTLMLLQQVGNAANRVPVEATAFPHRDARWDGLVLTSWDDHEQDEV